MEREEKESGSLPREEGGLGKREKKRGRAWGGLRKSLVVVVATIVGCLSLFAREMSLPLSVSFFHIRAILVNSCCPLNFWIFDNLSQIEVCCPIFPCYLKCCLFR